MLLIERSIARDLFLFGAPGTAELDTSGKLHLSEAGVACASMAAEYWKAHDHTETIVSLAGDPGYRQNATRNSLIEAGVDRHAIRPRVNIRYPRSVIDEACMAVERGLIRPARYSQSSPLGLVVSSPGHGRSAVDALIRLGFNKRVLMVRTPEPITPLPELALRAAYLVFVLGDTTIVEPEVLREREEQFLHRANLVRNAAGQMKYNAKVAAINTSYLIKEAKGRTTQTAKETARCITEFVRQS